MDAMSRINHSIAPYTVQDILSSLARISSTIDIAVYDVSSISIYHDFTLLVRCNSLRQMIYVCDAIYEEGRLRHKMRMDRSKIEVQGDRKTTRQEDWLMVECGDTWIYCFSEYKPTTERRDDDDDENEEDFVATSRHPVVALVEDQYRAGRVHDKKKWKLLKEAPTLPRPIHTYVDAKTI